MATAPLGPKQVRQGHLQEISGARGQELDPQEQAKLERLALRALWF